MSDPEHPATHHLSPGWLQRQLKRPTVDQAAIDAACDELSPQGAGWWHSDTADVIRAALVALTGQGMTVEAAADLLGGVIGAVQNEYGD